MKLYISILLAIPCFLMGANGYVANSGSNTVSIIDLTTNTVTGTIVVGNAPESLLLHGTTLYVANYNDGTVSVVDTNTNTVTDTITVENGPAAFGLKGNSLYVVNYLGPTSMGIGSVTVIDINTNAVVTNIENSNFDGPLGIAFVGNSGYVVNWGNIMAEGTGTTVPVIDTTNHTVTDVIHISPDEGPEGVAMFGTTIYTGNNSNPGTVTIINATNNTVTGTISDSGLIYPETIVISGNTGYVPNNGSNTLSIIDLLSNTVTSTVVINSNTGCSPVSVAILGNLAYVANEGDNSISILNLDNDTYTFVSDPMTTFNGPSFITITSVSSGPTAPTSFAGRQKKNNFAVAHEYFNSLTWTASTDPSVVGYVLQRNGEPLANVGSQVTQYQDHQRNPLRADIYTLYSTDSDGNLSEALTIQVGG